MKLSKTERRYLQMALHNAELWNDSIIDAYTTELYITKRGDLKKRIPKEWQPFTNSLKRETTFFRKLDAKLRSEGAGRQDEKKPK